MHRAITVYAQTFQNQLSYLLGSQRSAIVAALVHYNRKMATAKAEAITVLGVPTKIRKNPAIDKIKSKEFYGIFTPELKKLIEIFKKYNHEMRIAGGAVRDILMSIPPKDVDLATTATPDQMKIMFEQENIRLINAKGEKHGTITPRINDKENFEITTLRIDVRTDGRHAEVRYTTDWQLDANRRDLTINSMFLGFDGTLYDYFYGYDDLKKRRVVFVGDPNVRIKEDYLRILRYFRFFGRISPKPNNHDKDTLTALKKNIVGLARISGERIWNEMGKIVTGNFADEIVIEMIKCGISPYTGLPIDPNITEFKRVFSALEKFPKPHQPILYMIALLNTTEDAMALHERLKLSAFERDLALFITQIRQKVIDEEFKEKDYKMLCVQPAVKIEFILELLKYMGMPEVHKSIKNWQIPHFPLNGNMLKELGCPPGRQLGEVMNQLKLIWADSNFLLSAEDLIDLYYPEVVSRTSAPSSPKKRKN